MFECRACIGRAARAVTREVLDARTTHRHLISTPRLSIPPSRRRLATSATATTSHDGDSFDIPTSGMSKSGDMRRTSNRPKKTEAALSPRDEKALRTEVEWLKDPKKFADHVHYTLRNNQPDKALDLCRIASRKQDCVVAWNHTIDWHVQQGRYARAIEIYNEMKKRGQFPDSHTYMMLFRSFPQHQTHQGLEFHQHMCTKALKIYTSMNAPDARVKPSIMHTNAMLRLCSLAGDMDALWNVASQIPESGPSAADYRTYSVLIGAIRHAAKAGDGKEVMPQEEYAQKMQKAVNEGRRIWQEVVVKWRGGEVAIDEQLVVEMANLLLISKRMQDWDDVLALVQQTTKIERLIAPVGSPDRTTGHVPREAETVVVEDSEGWVESPANHSFKPVIGPTKDPEKFRKTETMAWVAPGNGLLSVLLDACREMRIPKTAQAYWDELTSKHDVRPDLNNFQSMLRILNINRSSKKAVEVVERMHSLGIKPRNVTYRLAMSACQRDWKNTNIMHNATALIDDMQKHLLYPECQTLECYLSLALQTADGKNIIRAIDRMDPLVHLMRSRIVYGADGVESSEKTHILYKETALRVIKSLIGAIDTLMNRGLVPKTDFAHWSARRSHLQGFVGRSENSVQDQRDR
ncbi:hypothetical protein DOTSEDRAFT_110529, partial [Dothistroma septosporum NZE10]